jgi:hypothetical protein
VGLKEGMKIGESHIGVIPLWHGLWYVTYGDPPFISHTEWFGEESVNPPMMEYDGRSDLFKNRSQLLRGGYRLDFNSSLFNFSAEPQAFIGTRVST